jgi:hypothetical protein
MNVSLLKCTLFPLILQTNAALDIKVFGFTVVCIGYYQMFGKMGEKRE